MNQLPPLNPLRSFEAAGRLKSVRKAAEELCVTAGAVSRQIQSLETHLGLKLFRREPRSVVLTAAGEQYLAAVTEHLDGIRDATQKLTGAKSREILKIRAYTTFAMKWLVPRLSAFQEMNSLTEVDRLVRNELIPICSPGYRRQMGLKKSADLARVPLLHSLARPDDWMYWLKAAGLNDIDPYAGPKYESSVLTYQAALDGQGVAMAQQVLVAEELRKKRLVQPFGPALDRKNFTYYLIYPQNRLRKPALRKFRAWLTEVVLAEE
jgi:LysR family glycine cleavage system transcriptional activator